MMCPFPAKSRARTMRAEPTEAERKLWYVLRDRRMQALKFRRQAPVGPYIVDFLCIAHRLVVEADGSQHAESKRDAIRDAMACSGKATRSCASAISTF